MIPLYRSQPVITIHFTNAAPGHHNACGLGSLLYSCGALLSTTMNGSFVGEPGWAALLDGKVITTMQAGTPVTGKGSA